MIFKTAILFLLLTLVAIQLGEDITSVKLLYLSLISIVTAILDKALDYE